MESTTFGGLNVWSSTTSGSELYSKSFRTEIRDPYTSPDVIHSMATTNYVEAYTTDSHALSEYNILHTIEQLKSKLANECRLTKTYHHIECRMTPTTKQHIILAGKRLAMFGKKKPIIANFDEFGRRLPDVLNVIEGVKIIIEKDDIELSMENDYLCLKGIYDEDQTTEYYTVDGEVSIKEDPSVLKDYWTSPWDSDS